MNQNTSHGPCAVCLATSKHDLTGNRPTQKNTRVQRFSRPPAHRGLQALTWPCTAVSCADMHFNCVSSRGNSGFFYTSAGGTRALLSLASQTMLLSHAVSEPISHDQGSLISATLSFDYPKWTHYCIRRSHKGYDCLASSLLFLQDIYF